MGEPSASPPDAAGPDDFGRARVIFESALDRPPAERGRFIQQTCGDNTSLLAAVQGMLRADSEPHPWLDGGPLHTDRWRPGDSFAGHYRIDALIGRGGMGEVYRAHDATLGRDVALKVLPSTLPEPCRSTTGSRASGGRRRCWPASITLDIAAIHGFEEAGGVRALVLELVEGPTLADRIAAGPLPLEDTVGFARQIAVGLEAAHEQGIVHRNLKPGNVKLRPDGTVKLLDFGLAKMMRPDGVAGALATSSPTTITSPSVIERGVLLGTAAYVSPEQAKGREANRRSDVWAFGAVLYEMLSGCARSTATTSPRRWRRCCAPMSTGRGSRRRRHAHCARSLHGVSTVTFRGDSAISAKPASSSKTSRSERRQRRPTRWVRRVPACGAA